MTTALKDLLKALTQYENAASTTERAEAFINLLQQIKITIKSCTEKECIICEGHTVNCHICGKSGGV